MPELNESAVRPSSWGRSAQSLARPAQAAALAKRGRFTIAALVFALLAVSPGRGAETVHELNSPRQAGPTQVRVFSPDGTEGGRELPLLLVLPVEAGTEDRWGDPAAEVRRLDLANRHRLLVALPTFSALPWYADHPTDPNLQQESYILEDLLPMLERRHQADVASGTTLLVGFSKSGWGAWSLLLRHPDRFDRAAAWDAPLMQPEPDRFGMGPVFGTVENFRGYKIADLVRQRAGLLRERARLVLTGYFDSFRSHHQRMHALLVDLGIPHTYRDGPKRRHHWESGWLEEAVGLLVRRPDPDGSD